MKDLKSLFVNTLTELELIEAPEQAAVSHTLSELASALEWGQDASPNCPERKGKNFLHLTLV